MVDGQFSRGFEQILVDTDNVESTAVAREGTIISDAACTGCVVCDTLKWAISQCRVQIFPTVIVTEIAGFNNVACRCSWYIIGICDINISINGSSEARRLLDHATQFARWDRHGTAGFGSSLLIPTEHTTCELCFPSEAGLDFFSEHHRTNVCW